MYRSQASPGGAAGVLEAQSWRAPVAVHPRLEEVRAALRELVQPRERECPPCPMRLACLLRLHGRATGPPAALGLPARPSEGSEALIAAGMNSYRREMISLTAAWVELGQWRKTAAQYASSVACWGLCCRSRDKGGGNRAARSARVCCASAQGSRGRALATKRARARSTDNCVPVGGDIVPVCFQDPIGAAPPARPRGSAGRHVRHHEGGAKVRGPGGAAISRQGKRGTDARAGSLGPA